MEIIVQIQVQECLELCKKIEDLLQEHRTEMSQNIGGELEEAYSKALQRADEMTDELKAGIRRLCNS